MKKKNNKNILPIILILLVCVGLVIGFWVYGHREKNKQVITSGGNVQEVEDSTTITYAGKKYL